MKSMTGFGKNKLEINGRSYSIEIKSVNHRYCDINVKLPRSISFYENEIKKLISSKVSRGKIDVFVEYTNYTNEGKSVVINKDLAKIYIQQLKELALEEKLNDDIKITEISKMPDVLQLKVDEGESDIILNELMQCLNNAVENFVIMRETEGEKIKEDLQSRLNNINTMVQQISENTTGLIDEYVVKLGERIKEILKTDIVDETRIAQETVIYADKSSVQEELTRLKSHIQQFKNLLQAEGAIGKKLDFIIQEMNREANTIASKSVKLEITNLVIQIKTELEDIREQVQNIE
ncbi:MAG: YicC family protein [Clostridia bacterium]|nr:YicC family protein [Clostridia bacterium]